MKKIKSAMVAIATVALMFASATSSIAATPESSDTWIQTKLVTSYVLNRHLSAFDIDTDVRDQVVYLKGIVETPIEKNLAEEIARSIRGVKNVKNNIAVDQVKGSMSRMNPSTSDERTFSQTINDMTTTATIKSKFLTNENVHGLDINVDTKNSVVTLRGNVPSDVERDLVAKIAQNTEGVAKVNNDLTVRKNS